MTRRLFLKICIATVTTTLAGLTAFKYHLFQSVNAQLSKEEQNILSRYLNTLIPSDETPGGLDLNVHIDLLTKAERDQFFRSVIKDGCHWLNQQAHLKGYENYLILSELQQEEITALSAEAESNTTEYKFFTHIRHTAFHFYYAKPQVWHSLGFNSPPQPNGFPDFQSQPKGTFTS